MTLEWSALVPWLVPAALSLVWLVRLEGRVSMHEAVCSERYRRLEERHVEALEAIRSLDAKLDKVVP